MIFLILLFWPFVLLYFYVKWCISNNSKNLDRPLNKRPWLWTTVALLLVFLIASIFAPRNVASTEPLPSSSPSAVIAMESPAPSATPSPTATPTATPTPTPSPTPTPTPTPESTPIPTPTPAPTPEPQPESLVVEDSPVVPNSDTPDSVMVWVPTNGGKKYHSNPSCSQMVNPQEVTLDEAIAMGFTPCKRCYG